MSTISPRTVWIVQRHFIISKQQNEVAEEQQVEGVTSSFASAKDILDNLIGITENPRDGFTILEMKLNSTVCLQMYEYDYQGRRRS